MSTRPTAGRQLTKGYDCRDNVSGTWARTADTLRAACGVPVSRSDALVAQHVARVISNRAAQLVSVCEYRPRLSYQLRANEGHVII